MLGTPERTRAHPVATVSLFDGHWCSQNHVEETVVVSTFIFFWWQSGAICFGARIHIGRRQHQSISWRRMYTCTRWTRSEPNMHTASVREIWCSQNIKTSMSDIIVISMVVSPHVNISERRILRENWQHAICIACTQAFRVDCSYDCYHPQFQTQVIESREKDVGRHPRNPSIRTSGQSQVKFARIFREELSNREEN